ncbi:MAG TPA: hypothetical protein VMH30_09935 [Verrucomicrobiae bacterium]|nr:hypothetical protein [Verrucomicrobiae bacterium]
MSRCAKIAIVVGTVVITAILISIIHHYRLRAEVNAYIAELKASGELLDLAQVIPPPVPPEQNDAPEFLKTASAINTNWDALETNPPPAMRMVAPGKAMIGWAQPDIRSSEGTNSWEEIQAALAKEEDALNTVQQISNRPELDCNINYAGGFEKIRLTYLAGSKRAAMGLCGSAIFDLHRGDPASAVQAAHSMLLIANAMQHDRLVISELVRIAIAQLASAATWEILQSTNVTDEQLAQLQQDWANLDFVPTAENALLMERTMGQMTLAHWRRYGFPPYLEEGLWNKAEIKIKIFLWRYWWSYPDELRALKGYDALLGAVEAVQTNGSFQNALGNEDKQLNDLGISKLNDDFLVTFTDVNLHTMLSQSIVTLAGFARNVMCAEVAKQVTMTAIALKRYQLKNGDYPTDLSQLVPAFLPAVPLDPVDGKPLRYRSNGDGTFLLYSVGENGKDDGGNPSLENGAESSSHFWENQSALDWVWPQPATPQEVQNYYANLGK